MTSIRAVWADRLSPDKMWRIALGLTIGALGGFIAEMADVPLAWMLGALFANMIASVGGAPVDVPLWLRACFMGVVGLFLGEAFGEVPLEQMRAWPLTMLAAILYIPVAIFICYLFYTRLAKLDRMTAILCSAPGGLLLMSVLATEVGGDDRRVALSQSLRITVVILSAPFIAFGLIGFAPPDETTFEVATLIAVPDAALLIAISVACVLIAKRLGMPLSFMIAPLLVSAVLRLGGVIDGDLPHWMVNVALVVTGSSIGSRFKGVKVGELLLLAGWSVGGACLLMAVAGVFAWVSSVLLGVDLFTALLAYAPGGVAEMSLIAIAIDANPSFVAAHHVARIVFIMFATPIFTAWLRRKADAKAALNPD